MELLRALVTNFWFWIFGLPLIIWGASEMISAWLKHRERMAMIERGIHPDAPQAQIQTQPPAPVPHEAE